MKILVCGGRDYIDKARLFSELDKLKEQYPRISHLIHGAARGADSLADAWALARGIQPVSCKANWAFFDHGRAGVFRNAAMLGLYPDLVVAFPGGRGTANMVLQARTRKVPVIQIA